MSYQLQVPNTQTNTLYLGQSWNIKPESNGLTFSYNGIPQAVIPQPLATSTISFYLNGRLVKINNPDPSITLLDYLRYQINLVGTRKFCNQGGCGICAVMVSYFDNDSNLIRNLSVNSCLYKLVNCDGCAITTNEGIIPNPSNYAPRSNLRYHPVQERIAKTYGLQCGACTSGIVMTTYSALQPNSFIAVEPSTVEKLYDGNICRCSCYNGITKMTRSFLSTAQVKDSSNNVIGYNTSVTGASITSQNLIQYKSDASNALQNAMAQSINLIQTTPGLVNVSQVVTQWTNAAAAISVALSASVSNMDIYKGLKNTNSALLLNYTTGLITLGVAATGPMLLALKAAPGNTGPWYPLSNTSTITRDTVFSALADSLANSIATNAINAAIASAPTDIANTIANLVAIGAFGAGSTGANLLAQLLGYAAQGLGTTMTSWVANAPQLPGVSLYRANGTISDIDAFTNYNPANDVNGNNYSSFLQSYVKGPAVFIAPEPFNFAYHRVNTLTDAINVMRANGVAKTELVVGTTSYGIPGYERKPNITAYIDINNIPELNATSETSSQVTIGANVKLNKLWKILSSSSDFKFQRMAMHFSYIAGQHVRNLGSWVGGFTMTKRTGFAGDTATILASSRGSLNVTYIFPTYTQDTTISVRDYLNTDLSDRYVIIRSLVIPKSVQGEFFDSYRISQRYFNAYPMLNNSINFILDGSNTITSAIVAYGALTNTSVKYATNAESYLVGKQVTFANINSIMSGVLPIISAQIQVNPDPYLVCPQYPNGRTNYRNSCIQSFFYLSFCKLLRRLGFFQTYPQLASIETGIEDWVTETRITNSTYEYLYEQIPDEKFYPLHFAMPKWDAPLIAATYGKFNDDLQTTSDCLFAGVAHTTVASGKVDWNNPITINSLAKARATEGVVHVITAIEWLAKGWSNVHSNTAGPGAEILANVNIKWNGNPLAIILATRQDIAYKVAKELVVAYKDQTPIYLTIKDALNAGAVYPFNMFKQLYDVFNYAEVPIGPYRDGDGALELQSNYINYNPISHQNLIPTSGVFTTGPFVGLQKWTDSTGVDHVWSPLIAETETYAGDVHHFPMEKHTCYTYPDSDGILHVYPSWQSITTSKAVFALFGLNYNTDVRVHIRRIGGGFGHKLGFHIALFGALAVGAGLYANCPMKFVADIDTDLKGSGARTDLLWQNKIGFRPDGTIVSLDNKSNQADGLAFVGAANGGLVLGEMLSMLESQMPIGVNLLLDGQICNLPRAPRSVVRSAGHAEAAFAYANILDSIAAITGLNVSEVSQRNIPNKGTTSNPQTAQQQYTQLVNIITTDPRYNYTARRAAVNAWNSVNKYKKRGIEFQMHRYNLGQYFTFGFKDAVCAIEADGTVKFWISCSEMGQGTIQKALQSFCQRLKVPMSKVFPQEYDSNILQGETNAGGSAGSEAAVFLASELADKVLTKLGTRIGINSAGDKIVVDASGNPILDTSGNEYNLSQGVLNNNPAAWMKLVSLFNSVAFAAPQGQAGPVLLPGVQSIVTTNPPLNPTVVPGLGPVTPNSYVNLALRQGANDLIFRADTSRYVQSAESIYYLSMSEVEVDVLTGNIQILRVDVLFDIGESNNRGIDAGQLEGGYIFGSGYYFTEERYYGYQGEMLSTNTWEYKPPCPANLPQKIYINFIPNPTAYSQRGDPDARNWTFGAKATQEMGCVLQSSAYCAVKAAIRNYRIENGLSAQFNLNIPATNDKVKEACGIIPLTF